MDGRVGMAALLAEEGAPAPCMATLYEQSAAQLPVYAQPRFVRVLRDASEVRHNAAPATSPAAIRPQLPYPKFRYSRPSPSSRAPPRCGTRASTQTKCRASSCATRRRAPTCRSTRGRTRRSSRAGMCWADWTKLHQKVETSERLSDSCRRSASVSGLVRKLKSNDTRRGANGWTHHWR